MKIYTKTGDKGKTSLLSGRRVGKNDLRIEAYGTIDELNSWVGVIRDHSSSKYEEELVQIQNELFTIGSQLANDPQKATIEIPDLSNDSIKRLENKMDVMNESLPEMRNFILPGGHPLVSYTHLARCVCRRAERRIVDLMSVEAVPEHLIQYVNRLSDYFFVVSRAFSFEENAKETPWNSNT